MAVRPRHRDHLLRKYFVILVALVSGAVLTSGLLDIYFTYRENEHAVALLLREKALAAAGTIEQSARDVEREVRSTSQPLGVPGVTDLYQRQLDYLRVFSQTRPQDLAITDFRYLDASGSEQLWVARDRTVVEGSQADHSADLRFLGAGAAGATFGLVEYRAAGRQPPGPIMSVSLAEPGARGGVTVAEVNLSSLWEAVVKIKIGKTGWTYVVDGQGKLLAHPFRKDLQQTDVSGSPQVRKALSEPPGPNDALVEPMIGPRLQPATDPNAARGQVINSWAGVPATGWLVFVEQPIEEAFAPIYAAVARTVLLLLLGLVLATLASLLLARRMVAPIRALQAGAVRIGAGDLEQRIQVRSGDELEALADEFNAMSTRLQESYTTLEQRVEERTRERNALSDVSQAIGSTLDVEQVLTRVVEHAVQFSVADAGAIYAYDESTQQFFLRATLHFGSDLNDGLRLEPPQLGEGAVGQAGQERAIVQIPDIQVEGTYHGPLRERLLAAGFRSLLALPLLAEERLQGALVVARKTPGAFSAEAVTLLRTFASQSALPIQNARLYQEKIELNHTLDARVQQQVGELERVRRLERYFSPQVAELILSGEASLEQKNRREVTVVFCDLRGYTAFSNRAPEYVIDVLNEYHRALGELIWNYEGTLERFAGDGLMVFFNDPVPCENPHERAVRMAIEMRDRMDLLTERWRYEQEAELGFGVGIDHGYASTGRIGFEGRFDYAAIGEPTNRAARLCAEAGNDQILISQRVYARVDQLVDAELIGMLDLKGFPEPVRTYNVLGLAQSTPSAPRF